ncbi:hypothetical protein [Clostridium butyricum]|uniref:hypothetical protein n=1 Tax=Clostridium butyricum TaxID=1492 RepID=UPI0013CF9835|nr:hypothetical protein [Clostridium butyricum]MCQ2017290.1 hypothetical protein [Clostridium butyricum]MCQ2021163.1 hypothetical protein [Clostridium butyricum]NFB72519.1 hypothetical protein [Clostridium butyricum]NFB91556.1 hypothetical protein [Clostridium butyricum]UTY53573.1 hypothetical protein HNS01_10890 [Clostridium butyricum]
MKINNIVDVNNFEGNSLKDKIEDGYKKIGQYLINNSKQLASDVSANISEIELNIKIPSDYVVTLEKKTNFYVMEEC